MEKDDKTSLNEGKLSEVLSAVDTTVLEMVSSGAPLCDVLHILSQVIEEHSPGLLCSIFLVDPSGKNLRRGAAPSLPDSYARAIDGMAIGPCAGSCGTAAYRGELVIVSDIATDPLWADYRELGLSHGLRACWSTPIVSGNGKVLGTFAMYCREPRSPSGHDLQVIERATHLAAIAIERERAEEALRQAENKYRNIVENAVEGFFQTTPAGGYVSVNPALARMYGYKSPEELMAAVKDIGRQVYADFSRRAEFKRVMQEHGLVQGFEYQVYRKDGSKIWLSENARAVCDASGAALYYEGTVVDITERKRAEVEREVIFEVIHGVNVTAHLDELLRLIHQSLKKVLYAENCFIALQDRNTGMLHFPFFVDQFDAPPPPQRMRKGCTAYVVRTGRPQLITEKIFRQLVEQGEVELVGTHSPAWLGVPLQAPSETIGALVVQHYEDERAYTKRDLEFLASVGGQIALAIERKQAEEALRLTQFAVDRAADAAFWIGPDARFFYVNEEACRALGYLREQLLSMSVHDIDPDLPAHVWPETWRRVKQWVSLTFESHHRTKDGRVFPVEIRANYLEFRGKEYICAFARDITERNRLEDQLRQAQKMEAVGRLAGGVAHDFNNLLMVIKGYSELMLDRLAAAEPLRKNAEEIKKAADGAASLTRQLLAFSRMQILQPNVLDLNAIVAEMGKMLPRLIGEDIELTTVLSASLGRVKADQSQIQQVILNLAVNARDAMPQGGKLTIETANVDLDESYARRHAGVRPGPYAMLAVSDTGVGMDAETQASIFEPFFTTKEQGKGTGLGLATVYGVVKQSGGWIWVYSEVGQGTTFKIYLPRVEEVVEEAQPAKTIGPPPRGSETILVVEDQQSLRQLTCEFLRDSGYTVLEASDGEEGLEIAERYQGMIHLLLTDVVMPKMGGRELAHRMTALHPQMKALYMSGYAEHARTQHGSPDLTTVCLQKPFALDTLVRKVREVLAAERGVEVPPK